MITRTQLLSGDGSDLNEISKQLGVTSGFLNYAPICKFDKENNENKYYVNKKYEDGRLSFFNGKLVKTPYVQLYDKEGRFYTNSKLTVSEYRKIDRMLKDAQTNFLSAINQFVESNLVEPVEHIGIKEVGYQQVSHGQTGTGESVTATMGMNGLKSRSAVDKKQVSIPLPFFGVRVDIDRRDLVATQNGGGEPLDLTEIRMATREVNQALNLMALNGLPDFQYKQGVVRGLSDANVSVAFPATGDWGVFGNIYDTINGAINVLENTSKIPGPYNLLVNSTQYGQLRSVNSQTDKTAIQIVYDAFNLPGRPPKINSIEPVQYGLNDGEVLIYAASPDWVQWHETLQTQVIELPQSELDGISLVVIAIATVMVKTDYNDVRGVVKVTGA